ncbi:SAM-dependent methyltransferase [Pseudonocardia petroleophila]|uniref:SAM-dependent methyltransferase n=1 Tax=Pseudonocardia petroleophila TaxID=37331 RepID=UPI002106F361|nr:class I SAM-dependent methyltransferase [Pseudonocardia petroleophila]
MPLSPADLFWAAHADLPREAPGSPATLRLLLGLAGPLPERPHVVDVGCGPGTASLLLARETGGTVTALDTHGPFLDRLRDRAAAEGLGDRVRALEAPMQDVPLPDGAADLVWAEGSAYVMGFDAALAGWRRLLAPDGVLVLTEAEWTTPDPAPAARAFWDAGYPAMRTTADNVAAAQDAGWTVAATYLLPDSDWAAYYDPLAARIAALRAEHPGQGAALDEVGAEIGVRREHGGDYGYTAYVLRPRHGTRPFRGRPAGVTG